MALGTCLCAVEAGTARASDIAQRDAGSDMCKDGDGQDEVFQAGGLVDWSREQEVGFTGRDGAGDQRDK
jgi:hypothetical protein